MEMEIDERTSSIKPAGVWRWHVRGSQAWELHRAGTRFSSESGRDSPLSSGTIGKQVLPLEQRLPREDGQFENIPATYRSSVNAVNARGDLTGETFTHRQTQPPFFSTHCK
jgi:hypothetical protein